MAEAEEGGQPGWAAPVLICLGCFGEEERTGRGAFGTRHAQGRQDWREPNTRIKLPSFPAPEILRHKSRSKL